MGNILRLFLKDGDASCCSLPRDPNEIFVDLENAQPANDELETYQQVEVFLSDFKDVLEEFKAYTGAASESREAMQNKTEENEEKAWNKVLECMTVLKKCVQLSARLDPIVSLIFSHLSASGEATSVFERLDAHQALVKQFAHLVEYVQIFDEIKMLKPVVQNDLSFFRRSLHAKADQENKIELMNSQGISPEITEELRSFFQNPTPMLVELSKSLTHFFNSSSSQQDLTTEIIAPWPKFVRKCWIRKSCAKGSKANRHICSS